MKKYFVLFFLFTCMTGLAQGQIPTWHPLQPTQFETVDVYIEPATESDVLHWAVVVDETSWVRPAPDYRPAGSTLYGNAIRTPFENGRVTLGPFDDTNQVVSAVIFAILRADGSWDNNEGDDYLIPISLGRITFSPEHPTADDVITVTVHNSQPDGYIRWGANAQAGIWTAIDPVYWPIDSVMSGDGVGLDSPVPDPDENGLSILHIGPFNLGQQVIDSLHMAVHWDEEWDTDGGRNYNLDITWRDPDDPGAIQILTPRERTLDGEEVVLSAAAPAGVTRMEMWLNGRRLGDVSGPPFTRTLDLAGLPFGPYEFVIRTDHEGDIQRDARTFWHVPSTDTVEPPTPLEFGATEHDDGTVTFALFAPGKKFISLVGDFNCWDPNTHRMQVTADGTWWITVDLEPGTYRYQYEIDGAMRLGDPYARQVDWTNAKGQKGWMPADAKTVLHVGAEPFQWTADEYTRPALEDLVIYELYIEDFVPGQGFTGVIEKLDYIKDLGFNAIEPLPWHPWPGLESWGYNPAFHFAVEQLYGTPEELKQLIDAAHQRGIAVIIDMVLNHAEWGSPLYQLYGQDYEASPYFREYHGHNWGFPKIDQQSPAVKRYVADVIRFWIEEYRIDGFRYDATRWTGWSGYNDWGASWYAYVARQADPDNIQIAEHLPIEPPLIIETEMDTGWHAEYRWRIREMISRAELYPDALIENLDGRNVGFESSFQRMPYTESHDEERVVNELRQAGFEEDEVFRRATLAMALPLLTPGVPMLFAGQEFGEDTVKNVGWNPLNWQYLENSRNQQLLADTRSLVRLRVQHPALKGENAQVRVADAQSGLAIFERNADPDIVHVAANFGRAPVTASLYLATTRAWVEVLDEAPVSGGETTFTLQPGEVRVWATDWSDATHP